jgi:hypothetical protein
MRFRRAFAGLLILSLLAPPAAAWNALGHQVIAEIAWRQLDEPARQEIVEVLRHHPRFAEDFVAKMPADVASADKAVQDRWIFQQAATWPDMAAALRGPTGGPTTTPSGTALACRSTRTRATARPWPPRRASTPQASIPRA